jgi:nanoRNase/pAp phosphatase (c-di-AMP/oligoRNAs hydrolase)
MEDFDKAKSSIENAKNIVIIGNKNADKDVSAATLAIFFALKNKKNIYIPKEKNSSKTIDVLSENNEKKKIVISLKNEISEIFYEKNNGGIDLFLIPKDIEELNPENFSFKITSEEEKESLSSPVFFDLIITINIKSFSELEEYFSENVDSIYNCTVINIDNNYENENYGEINIVGNNVSLSEKVALMLKHIQNEINEKTAGFLLWGITSSFDKKRSSQTMSIIKWLISQGGDLYFNYTKPDTKRKLILLEKTIENLNYLEKENVYISTLSEEDISSTESSSADLGFVIDKMKNYFSIPSFMLLWEGRSSPVSVKGVFYSQNEKIIKKIKDSYQGSYKGQGGIFITEKKEIQSAKKELISLLNYGK